jgi:hypothetical protein
MGKGQQAVPISILGADTNMMGTLRFAHPTAYFREAPQRLHRGIDSITGFPTIYAGELFHRLRLPVNIIHK